MPRAGGYIARMTAPRFPSYVICTSPRSGSTLLCALLKATGVAGRPGSHFHEPSLDEWLEDYRLEGTAFASREDALRAVFAAAREKGEGGTGVFGLRLQRGSFRFFMGAADAIYPGRSSDVERIEAAFGPTLFIHLRRADKLAQAVSRVMAEQTGLWHRAADGSELERLAPAQAPRYDREAIARHMAEQAALDGEWEDWFAREDVSPLSITYDELAADPQGALARVLEALGLDPSLARDVQPPTRKLADATSREWMERFTAETKA